MTNFSFFITFAITSREKTLPEAEAIVWGKKGQPTTDH